MECFHTSIGTKPIRLDVENFDFGWEMAEKPDRGRDLGKGAYATWNWSCASQVVACTY